MSEVSYERLKEVYNKHFSLCYISTDVSEKLALISLTGAVVTELRKKNPGITCFQVLSQICKNYPDNFKTDCLKPLSIICEDFMYGCTVFPDFGVKSGEKVKTIKEILEKWCPF